MIEKKTWKEFRETGLLLVINQILHIFGWAIIFDFADKEAKILREVYPARVKFRGFQEKLQDESYLKVAEYMKENADILLKEIREK